MSVEQARRGFGIAVLFALGVVSGALLGELVQYLEGGVR